jgi:hypothetical protein
LRAPVWASLTGQESDLAWVGGEDKSVGALLAHDSPPDDRVLPVFAAFEAALFQRAGRYVHVSAAAGTTRGIGMSIGPSLRDHDWAMDLQSGAKNQKIGSQ